jgi:hypothetical protein
LPVAAANGRNRRNLVLAGRSGEGLLRVGLRTSLFTINPVLVILALVFWYWMWGILGAILAVPMLAVTKIICDRVQPLASFGHLIEG